MKLQIICFSLAFIFFQTVCSSWQDMLEVHHSVMAESTYQLLMQQYQSFASGNAPAIADPRIKQIPIVENHEPVVDIAIINHPRISVMTDSECLLAHEFPEDIDLRSDGYSKMRASVFDALVRMLDELDRLAPAFGYKSGMLEIKLFEGLRDLGVQKELFDTKMAAIWAAYPTMTEEQAYAETSKWVSPYINNVPAHSTGAAIDIHLWDRDSQTFCDMGRFNVGGSLAPMFSDDSRLTAQQQNNRLLSLIAATQAGLIDYVFEFWHFSLGDRYAAFYHGYDVACYGSVA